MPSYTESHEARRVRLAKDMISAVEVLIHPPEITKQDVLNALNSVLVGYIELAVLEGSLLDGVNPSLMRDTLIEMQIDKLRGYGTRMRK